jgi:hypothetical protein
MLARARTARAHADGIPEGRLELDRRHRNPLTNKEFQMPALSNPRITRFSVPLLTNTELSARGDVQARQKRVREASDHVAMVHVTPEPHRRRY